MEKEFEIVAIHGEGDRETVNRLQLHRNNKDAEHYQSRNLPVPPRLVALPDEPPDVMVVLRDAAHAFRIEWPVHTWEEVEEWKKVAGYDPEKRHWQHGAKVKVTVGD